MKLILMILIAIILMFIPIFTTCFWIYEMNKIIKIIFTIFCIAELIVLIGWCYFGF